MRSGRPNVEDIQKRIKAFQRVQPQLESNDFYLGIGTAINSVLTATSIFNPTLGISAYALLFGYAIFITDRSEQSREAQDLLKQLIADYRDFAKLGPTVTQDPVFLSLLAAISVYVINSADLIPWDLKRINPHDLSEPFMEILATSPHKIQFVMLKGAVDEKNKFEDRRPKLGDLNSQNKWMRFFEQSLAEAKRAVYGYEEKNKISYAPRVNK